MIGDLYFEDKEYNKTLVAERINENNVCKCITETIKKLYPNYTIYYFNIWEEDGVMVYDFGSHSEFFHFIPNIN